jgi:hypothetical protein
MATSNDRRSFLLRVVAGGSALAAGAAGAQNTAQGGAKGKVDPKEPQAASLGYVDDTRQADKKRFPKHTDDQRCDGCQFFMGKPKDAQGPCTIFANRPVSGPGWCSAWAKKA